jgi:hypothetical protein
MTLERPPDERTVARLLSGRNAPSVLEKEQLFERIYARVAPAPRRAVWYRLGLAAAGAAVLVGALWLRVRPAPLAQSQEFAARGAQLEATESFRLLCSGVALTSCKSGSTLGFELFGLSVPRYFAAFARRGDGPVIWYTPSPEGVTAGVAPSASAVLLEQGVSLGSEHAPGQYLVYGVFSSESLSRAQIKAALGQDLRGRAGMNVVVRELEVTP